MKKIKILRKDTLTDTQMNNLIKNKKTINLWGAETSETRIERRKDVNKIRRLAKRLPKVILILFVLATFSLIIHFAKQDKQLEQAKTEMGIIPKADASEKDILEEYREYYEHHILKKRCYANQIKRLDDNKKITENYCEKQDNLEIFRTSYSNDDETIDIAFNFIKNFEGFHHKAYGDYKQYSIGYGTKANGRKTITREQAEKETKEVIQAKLLQVNRMCDNATTNQKVALISFMYNVGYKFDVLNYCKKKDHKSVIYLMSLYNKVRDSETGELIVLSGLQKRRQAEINLYVK